MTPIQDQVISRRSSPVQNPVIGIGPVKLADYLDQSQIVTRTSDNQHDGVLDTLVLPVVTAEAMSIFLAEVARRHPDEFILMFLDGAGWHRANSLEILENMKLEALPPYSPQLNPMEHIWDEVREKWFTNEVFDSLDGVEDRLVEALAALERDQELVASTTGFDWFIIGLLIVL